MTPRYRGSCRTMRSGHHCGGPAVGRISRSRCDATRRRLLRVQPRRRQRHRQRSTTSYGFGHRHPSVERCSWRCRCDDTLVGGDLDDDLLGDAGNDTLRPNEQGGRPPAVPATTRSSDILGRCPGDRRRRDRPGRVRRHSSTDHQPRRRQQRPVRLEHRHRRRERDHRRRDRHVTGSAAANRIRVGRRSDTSTARADADTVLAGEGDDTIEARDGAVDNIDCGAGNDTVEADFRDVRSTPTARPSTALPSGRRQRRLLSPGRLQRQQRRHQAGRRRDPEQRDRRGLLWRGCDRGRRR